MTTKEILDYYYPKHIENNQFISEVIKESKDYNNCLTKKLKEFMKRDYISEGMLSLIILIGVMLYSMMFVSIGYTIKEYEINECKIELTKKIEKP